MRPNYLAILPLLILGLVGTASAQVVTVQGELEITSINDTEILGQFTGDIEGAYASVIIDSQTYDLPFGTFQSILGEGMIDTATETFMTLDQIRILTPSVPGNGFTGGPYWFGFHQVMPGAGPAGFVFTYGTFEGDGSVLGYFGLFFMLPPPPPGND